MSKTRKKQFIASAICPQCSEIDSLVLYPDDQSIECVSCDYKQSSEQRDREKNAEKAVDKNGKTSKYKDASFIDITRLD